jgi:EAL and modified HD-GYP domain-containing signal transduction protein
LNIQSDVVAYEPLFRNGEHNSFPNVDPDQTASNILSDNHLAMGIEEN